MKDHESLMIAAGVSSHFLEDELLLFSTTGQRIYRLNPTAAFIWCLLEEGTDTGLIPYRISETFGIDPSTAADDMDGLLVEWFSAGLVKRGNDATASEAKAEAVTPQEAPTPFEGFVSDDEFDCEFYFNLAGRTFRMRLPSLLEERAVRLIFSHLETSGVPFDEGLDVVVRDGCYVILDETGVAATVQRPVEIGPVASQEALRLAYRGNDYLIAVHSGAVGNGEGCVVLPGPSGAGKSTLTAALMAEGFSYFTDEVAIIERDTHRLIPCPVSLRIKPGSWDIVRGLFGEPPVVCHTETAGGLVVKYVIPPKGSYVQHRSEAGPVAALVFPEYDSSCPTNMVPLPKSVAVQRLQTAGYDVHGDLTSIKVSELVTWISAVPCYDLRFRSLDEAVDLVRGVFR